MDVWDWLDPAWSWGAAFTGLFDWTAIAALATALAVIVALNGMNRTAAAERRRAIAILDLSLDIFQGMAVLLDTDEEGYLDAHGLQILLEPRELPHSIQRLAAIPISDWAETRVAMGLDSVVSTLNETLKLSRESLSRAGLDGRCPSFSWLSDFDFDHKELTEARRTLQFGMVRWFAPKPRFSFFAKPRKFSPNNITY